ncbi:MAG: NAD(P)-dependent oxidoreductase [Nocardioides sp.]|nr:NAD(P)-dependent oxidoreductase [Nocardioides sp.]
MTDTDPTSVTRLGLGAMGSALAASLVDAGHPTTVWNRTRGRDTDLVARGAVSAPTAHEAVTASPVVIACLYDAASVRQTLDPEVEQLRGRTLVNLTTTTPNESRELAAWAASQGLDYLDGAILAVPSMIGTPEAAVFYSGSRAAFEASRPMLDRWGTSTYDGEDPGRAALFDLAMLSGMYTMFAGFLHGAAMVGSEGVSAREFATRATAFIAAMTSGFKEFADVIDGGDYTVPGQQSLDFSDLSLVVRASDEQGVNPAPIAMVQALIRCQVAAGHGSEGFARIYESLRATDRRVPSHVAGAA